MCRLIILFILLICMAAINIVAEECYRLKVIGLDKMPINNVKIEVKGYEGLVETDKEGMVCIPIIGTGEVEIKVIHSDYIEKKSVLSENDRGRVVIIQLMPKIKQMEEVVITATRYPEKVIEVPSIETVVSSRKVEESGAVNVESLVQQEVGVSSIGSGGFSKVPSIRGMARKRILLLVDNARINSDRRTGPNASFVMPDDIDRIEIIRNSASVFYGSDAMGGVMHIITKEPDLSTNFSGKAKLKYGFNNQEKQAGISLNFGRDYYGFYLSLQGVDAENYKAANEEIIDSYYSNYGIFTKFYYATNEREIELSILLNRGIDIGKPSINSLEQPTWYPIETHNLFNILWQENLFNNDKISLRFYIDPNKLKTRKDTIDVVKTKETLAMNESVDYGMQITYSKDLTNGMRLNSGFDINGRFNVNADNEEKKFNSEGIIVKTSLYSSIEDGSRSDYGIFTALDYKPITKLDINIGLRYDYFKQSAERSEFVELNKYSSDAFTGFIGISYKLLKDIVFVTNIARAYRLPDLSERFYTGITGRGYVIGNSNLKAETSNNFDIGLKMIKKSVYVGLYGFYYIIDDMVERYKVSSNIYTYGNIEKGKIKGLEYEMEYYPYQGLKVFMNASYYYGKSEETGSYLNDVPPYRIIFGSRIYKSNYWIEINGIYQHKHNRVGPAEMAIPSYVIVNLLWGLDINNYWKVNIQVYNVFNRLYLGRPDPESVYEPGRSINIGISHEF